MPPRDPEPESRLAQEALPYQGPSSRNYQGRLRLMFVILGVFIAICLVGVVRVLTHGGL